MIAVEDLINTAILLGFMTASFVIGYWYRGLRNEV